MSEERTVLLGFPVVTADEIREVDRLAVEAFGITRTQMMELAGDRLASLAGEILGLPDHQGRPAPILLTVGRGDNGAGGLVAARHLANKGLEPRVVLTCEEVELGEETAARLQTLQTMEVQVLRLDDGREDLGLAGQDHPALLIDALVGCGLHGPIEGVNARLIRWMNNAGAPILSLDVPTGLDPTSGVCSTACVKAHTTMSLALPKQGLLGPQARKMVGRLILADIGLPRILYRQLGLEVTGRFPPYGRISLLA